jgi:hypothetical protein
MGGYLLLKKGVHAFRAKQFKSGRIFVVVVRQFDEFSGDVFGARQTGTFATLRGSFTKSRNIDHHHSMVRHGKSPQLIESRQRETRFIGSIWQPYFGFPADYRPVVSSR